MIRNALGLVIGLILGIRLTEYWDYSHMRSITRMVIPGSKDRVWLFNETRVLCLVLTNPLDITRMKAKVRSTWGKRCNKLIFIRSQIQKGLNDSTFARVQVALRSIYRNHFEGYDWFLKADANTYVIMENLRRFLYRYDPESSLIFGHRQRSDFRAGYMHGAAGYVLSRGAMRRLNLFAFNGSNMCDPKLLSFSALEDRNQSFTALAGTHISSLAVDRAMGLCLKHVGVIPGESRDGFNQERFLPLMPQWLMPGTATWKRYADTIYFKPTPQNCCSTTLISLHSANGVAFDLLEFFLYKMRVFGDPKPEPKLPQRLGFREMHSLLRYWSQVVSDNLEKPAA
ncbi:glycoprotein-N-acetylgalactosamine 3-beta-galactosyltransferase 1-like [Drosophila guanche]|uniref:N-acetylgalactosaminide beta-1,3-galactosyltransferase n=1 Tax=Drosophila guanche TaxID=7266 RepID=A0A3B0KGS2_DROGU|nr:glycoprotein-N-acetylgalactosamine 3-beta-galactosyltransferase 1-like [Drosophila guanche]SPP84936.1 blast:Glycoprotein-N-acetylgalactosamine 3-beta-galactosyltransferase 1 [Drosophila guanche]